MNTVYFGWEGSFNGNGANMGMEVTRDIILTGIQVDCSIMSQNATVGWAEVLFNSVAFPSGNIQFPPPAVYLGSVPNSDFSFDPHANFNDATGGTVHGGCGVGGFLFSAIAKMWTPSAASRLIAMPVKLAIPSGANILFHMDHAGVPCDAEMQGVFYYDEA